MDKKSAFEAVLNRCFAARITPSQLCARAKVSPANITHWKADPEKMSVAKLGQLEDMLAQIEAERSAA